MPKRIAYLDLAKLWAIFLVCTGHAFQMLSAVVFLLVPWRGPAVLTYDVLFHDPLQLPVQFVGGLSGSLLSIGLLMLICRLFHGGWKDRFADVGRYTLAIYGLQGVLLQNVVVRLANIDAAVCPGGVQQFVVAPAIGAATVAVCYGIARIMKKNKVTAKVMLGG